MPPTLRSKLSTRDNSLNFIRLLLAVAVIVNHSWPLGGFEGEPELNFGAWAVNGFFAISGFLIAGSRMRLGLREFLVNRVLRIFPAFWLVLLATAFVLAPGLSAIMGWSYSPMSAAGYAIKNAGLYVAQAGVWETLTTVPYQGVWNGSLWTLFYEFGAYIAAAVLFSVSFARRRPILISSLSLVALSVPQLAAPDLGNAVLFTTLRLGSFFAAGALLYFLSDRLKVNTAYLVAATALFAITALAGFAEELGQVPFGFVLLWLGARLRVSFGRTNDLSYGIYIWGWPIQQVLASFDVTSLGFLSYATLAVLLTVPIAWLSWVYVEKPALSLRKKIPPRWLGKVSNPSPPGSQSSAGELDNRNAS